MMMIPKTICYVWLLVMGVVAACKEKGDFAPVSPLLDACAPEPSQEAPACDAGEPTPATSADTTPQPAAKPIEGERVYDEDDPFANW